MYIVKEIKVGNRIVGDEETRWGVFIDIKDELNEGRVDPLSNLVCMCHYKINAYRIADILEMDERIKESDDV